MGAGLSRAPPQGVRAANPAAEKDALRSAVQAWRRRLQPGEIAARSQRIVNQLRRWPPLQTRRRIVAFLPLAREPRLEPLLLWLLARGATVAAPLPKDPAGGLRLLGAAGSLPAPVAAAAGSAPEPDLPGAVRPQAGYLAPHEAQLILVPGLAFDLGGGRLGRGRGVYDRVLAALPPACWRVGVCFREQVVPQVPRQSWDEPVDFVVTEEGIAEVRGERGARDG